MRAARQAHSLAEAEAEGASVAAPAPTAIPRTDGGVHTPGGGAQTPGIAVHTPGGGVRTPGGGVRTPGSAGSARGSTAHRPGPRSPRRPPGRPVPHRRRQRRRVAALGRGKARDSSQVSPASVEPPSSAPLPTEPPSSRQGAGPAAARRRLSVKSRSFGEQGGPAGAPSESTEDADVEQNWRLKAERQYHTQLALARLFGRPLPETPHHLVAQPAGGAGSGGRSDSGGGANEAPLKRYLAFAQGPRRDAMHCALHALARAAADGSGAPPSDAQGLSSGQFFNFLRDCHLLRARLLVLPSRPRPPSRAVHVDNGLTHARAVLLLRGIDPLQCADPAPTRPPRPSVTPPLPWATGRPRTRQQRPSGSWARWTAGWTTAQAAGGHRVLLRSTFAAHSNSWLDSDATPNTAPLVWALSSWKTCTRPCTAHASGRAAPCPRPTPSCSATHTWCGCWWSTFVAACGGGGGMPANAARVHGV